MSRDPLTRMDVDTRWPYNRKWRDLQRQHPTTWPHYFAAWMALLGEAWAAGDRSRTLEQSWLFSLPCSVDDAANALAGVGLLDRYHRIPLSAWKEWVEPAIGRIQKRSAAGRVAAEKRWSDRADGNAIALGQTANAMHHASHASQPATPRAAAHARSAADASRGAAMKPKTKRTWSKLGDELHAMAAPTATSNE